MKLLGASAGTVTTNNTVGKASAIFVKTTAATIITVVDSDGTAGGTNGTVVGSVNLTQGWTGIIHKQPDQFFKCDVTTGFWTKIDPGSHH